MCYGFGGGLRLNTLKMLETTGFCERKSYEVYRLCASIDKLLANEVHLQDALPQVVDQPGRVMKIATCSFDSNLRFCRKSVLGQYTTDEPKR